MISIKRTLAGSASLVMTLAALAPASAGAASSFSNNLWQFASGNGASVIDFNRDSSGIWSNGELHVASANFINLDASQRVTVSSALALNNGPLLVSGTAQVGKLNSVGDVNAGGALNVTGASTATGLITANGGVASDITRATGATGSFQPIAGDLTYQGAAGGTASFHAGVMGHFHGDTLTNTTGYHAGVIGGYSVTTSDATLLPKAGVVGSVGIDGATTAGTSNYSAGVLSVIEGDTGVVTANAAYGVQYLNSTSGSHFNYGLDLSHASGPGSYPAVTYGQADIRLSTGAAIASGAGAPSSSGATTNMCNLGAGKTSFARGSLYLNTTGSTSTSLYVCTATDTWTAK